MSFYRFGFVFFLVFLLFSGVSCDRSAWEPGQSPIPGEDAGEEGYFIASFFPAVSGPAVRQTVDGMDSRVQSLSYMIFRKNEEGVYVYVEDSRRTVFSYTGKPVERKWPLEQPVTSGPLPYGEYKVVFFGNMEPGQFEGQDPASGLVTLGAGNTFESVRIHMPEKGFGAFDEKKANLYYMAAASFSNTRPYPQVILQRLVAKSTFSRQLVDTQRAVDDLVQSVVDQVAEGNLTTDLIRGLLTTKLTAALSGLLPVTVPLTEVVDRLVNLLLGDIVTLLNESLLKQVEETLYQTLRAGGTDFEYLNILLNPWSFVNGVDASFRYAETIDLNRLPRTFREGNLGYVPLVKPDGAAPYFTVYSLNGNFRLDFAKVDTDMHLLQPALAALDENLLGGLLINILTSLSYEQENNVAYETGYDFLRLKLADDTQNGEPLKVAVGDLEKILNTEHLLAGIAGDGVLSALLGILLGDVVDRVIAVLLAEEDGLLATLDIHLPNLAIGNIALDGRWGATRMPDGTIVDSKTGGESR